MKHDTTGISSFLHMVPIGTIDMPVLETNQSKGEIHPWYGKHHTEDSKQRISAARKGVKASDATREKMSMAHSGKKKPDDVVRKIKSTRAARPYKHSDEAKARIGAAASTRNKGMKRSEEARAKMKEAQRLRRLREYEHDIG